MDPSKNGVYSSYTQPYLRVVAKKAGQAIHVLDHFHIMSKNE